MWTQLIVWLNAAASLAASVLLAPAVRLPGWVSVTLIGAGSGVAMLAIFKYTSNQPEIRRVRNRIKANLLALSLFKDSVPVSLRCQGRILAAAGRLLLLSIVPVLVMVLPVTLLLGQMAVWYQARPLRVGEEAVVTVVLRDTGREAKDKGEGAGRAAPAVDEAFPQVGLVTSSAVTVTVGPVRIPSKRTVCWNVQVNEGGLHELVVEIDGQGYGKELAVGERVLPTSLKRPEWSWSDVLLHPRERPFAAGAPVRSIEVTYPERTGWCCGTKTWLPYWFVSSLLTAFLARPLLRVQI